MKREIILLFSICGHQVGISLNLFIILLLVYS